MDNTLLNALTQFGPGIVLAAVVFLAYERHVTALQDVIRANTEALTKVATVLEENCDRLAAHDERAQQIEAVARHATEAIDRVEKTVTARSRTAARSRGAGDV